MADTTPVVPTGPGQGATAQTPAPQHAVAPLPEQYVLSSTNGQQSTGSNNTGGSIEIQSGGLKLKLPQVLLVQILTMAGALGGSHALNKADNQQAQATAQEETRNTASRLQRLEQTQVELSTKLARIEENTQECKDNIRELRQWLRVRANRDQ